MTVQTPKYNNWFSFGNVVTILFGIITATGMWFVMDARGKENARDIVELKAEVRDNEDEIENLKLNQVRIFEKLDSIYVGVTKIEAHLERQDRGN